VKFPNSYLIYLVARSKKKYNILKQTNTYISSEDNMTEYEPESEKISHNSSLE